MKADPKDDEDYPLEVAPGKYKPVKECTLADFRAAAEFIEEEQKARLGEKTAGLARDRDDPDRTA